MSNGKKPKEKWADGNRFKSLAEIARSRAVDFVGERMETPPNALSKIKLAR